MGTSTLQPVESEKQDQDSEQLKEGSAAGKTKMAYDDILVHLGEFGTYQKRIYLLLCLPAIVCALHKMASVFLQANVEHRCLLPFENAENVTYVGISDIQKNLSMSCEMYQADNIDDYLNLEFTSANNNKSKVNCNHWVYDRTTYQSTTVTEFDLVCSRSWLKAASDAVFMTGVLLGSIIFGDLSDRYGRRPIFFLSLVVQVFAGVLAGLINDIYSFTIFRMIVGATTSGVFLVAYVIALEMVGPSKRMFAGVAVQLFFTAGYLFTALFAFYIRSWRILQIAITLPGVLFFSYYWFIPESARWLITNGCYDEAKEIVRAVAKENKVEIEEELLDNLLAPSEEGKKKEEAVGKKPSLFDLFRHPNLRRKSLVIFFLWFVNSGTYYGLSWNTSNLGQGDEYLKFLISGAVEVPAYTFLLFTLNTWGRKAILCGSMLAAGVFLLLCMFVPQDMPWLTVTLAMMGKLAITASYGTVYIFTAEQFPTSIRNVGMGASSTSARVGAILAPFGTHMANVWQPLPLLVFGVLALTGGISALTLPETLNKKLPDTIEDGENFGMKQELKEERHEEKNQPYSALTKM